MKRRITIEVDDQVFPVGTEQPDHRRSAEILLGYLVGRVQLDLQRHRVPRQLEQFGVRLIEDVQL